MRRRMTAGCLLALLTGCAAHEKNGDRAASVGDWKTAYFQYREATSRDPDDEEIRTKFRRSRREALADASRKATACAATQQWACAVGEADFSLEVQPGDTQMARFRQSSAHSLAEQRVEEARAHALARDFAAAFTALDEAARYGSPGLSSGALAAARLEVAALADTEAERFRQQRAFPEALALLTQAAAVDPTRAAHLDSVRAEHEQFLDAEHARLASEADVALSRRDWARAHELYAAAAAMRPQGRAAPLAAYAGHVQQAELALAAQDFLQSADAYRRAVATGEDPGHYAQDRLAAVELRPYTVRVRSVLALPAGGFVPELGQGGRGNARTRAMLIAMADRVPLAERPDLAVIVLLPDGPRLATPTRKALYTPLESRFSLYSNQFEERTLSFRVVDRRAGGDVDLGLVEVPLRALLQGRTQFYEGGAVASLELQADPWVGGDAAAVVDMTPEGAERPHGSPGRRPPTASRPVP